MIISELFLIHFWVNAVLLLCFSLAMDDVIYCHFFSNYKQIIKLKIIVDKENHSK